MANTLISIRISDELLNDASAIAKQEGFSNVQEFFRQSVREGIIQRKKALALLELQKLYGSAKGKEKIASKKELDVLAKKLFS
jgi:metal-responsive CopG/Arc/MetJ family transcriptional regulator